MVVLRSLCAVALSLALAPAIAAPGDTIIKSEDGLDFIVPKGSPVELNALGYYAEFAFRGAFTLSGTFTYGFRGETDEDIHPVLYFTPDRASARVLPHWPGELAKDLSFSNVEAFIEAAAPAAQLAAFRARREGTISGRVTVRADSWHAILGCGDAYYSARFVKVTVPANLTAPQPLPDENGC